MSKHPKTDLYIKERAKGLTLREIADKYEVSYQAVAIAIAKVDPTFYKTISSKGCIYPNLRRWLNKSLENQHRLFSALKGKSTRDFLNGTRMPKKDAIDIMLKVTGMTYEELFAEEVTE